MVDNDTYPEGLGVCKKDAGYEVIDESLHYSRHYASSRLILFMFINDRVYE